MKVSNQIKINPYYKAPNTNFAARNPLPQVGKYFHIENSGYHPNIQAAMKRLAEYKVEHGIIFTKDGRLILETSGTKHKPFSDKLNSKVSELCEKNPRHIYLHNHPSVDKSGHAKPVTLVDTFFVGYRDGSESLVVHPDYTYSSVKCLPREKKISYTSVEEMKILLYCLTSVEREALKSSGVFSNAWWKRNAKKLGVIYKNTHDYTLKG